MTNWFEVDKQGLAKILERKGKEFAVFELIQNAWDENTTKVGVTLTRAHGSVFVKLMVTDDNPQGFKNLSHAFTLFAESTKKDNAEKRGRFNLGEKLVLALCREAAIETTTGTFIFDEKGRRETRHCLDQGTIFTGIIRMTAEEQTACEQAIHTLLPPAGIQTFFQGELLQPRTIIKTLTETLPTEIADSEGNLRKSKRAATVEICKTDNHQEGWLYEMGIPVVELDCKWHVNVMQKVPLSFDRDNVPPSYISLIRAIVLNAMQGQLDEADVTDTWVKDAMQSHPDLVTDETVEKVMALRFGENRVVYDPSDKEANSIAMSRGYTVVHGSQLSSAEWDAVRRSKAILPAGKVTPSPKPFHPDGTELVKFLPREDWTPQIARVAQYIQEIAPFLIERMVDVRIANDPTWGFNACYSREKAQITINLGSRGIGHQWFSGNIRHINRLIIHEFAHQYESDHFAEGFHEACCKIGGILSEVALVRPEIFDLKDNARKAA